MEDELDAYGCAVMEAVTDGFYDGTLASAFDIDASLGVQFSPEIRNAVCHLGNDITNVHWVYVDNEGIVHNSYQYGMQRDMSHQFCQTYALHMAIFPDTRRFLTTSSAEYIRRVAHDIWMPYFSRSRRAWCNLLRHARKLGATRTFGTAENVVAFLTTDRAVQYFLSW